MTDHVVFTTMGEVAQGIREVKINQIEKFFDERMKKGQEDGVKFELRKVRFDTFRKLIREMPTKLGYIIGLSIGIFLMIRNEISPGDLVVFGTLLNRVAEPLNEITQTYSNFQKSLRSANDLLKLVDEPEENYDIGESLIQPITSIKFNDVSFSYKTYVNKEESDAPGEIDRRSTEDDNYLYGEDDEKLREIKVIDNVSFEIKGGSTVALVGPSGSGKSTLIKLLYRFYEPTNGEITVNNISVNRYNINSLRSAMSIVSQDTFIFDGTVRENLVLGRKDINEKDIENALKFSESYDFVMNLADGLDSNLGERGLKLSQGQKQRISIARAIIKRANIIILDEPTSALDVETEYSFQQNIAKWAKDCTKFIIAHRLTTIRDADYVLFLENGVIAEQGSPFDLIKKENGKFKEYWEKQFLFQE